MGQLFTGPPKEALEKVVLWIQSIHPSVFSDVELASSPKIICVGDVVTKNMLEHPLLSKIVKICFVDGETQRGAKVVFKKLEGMVERKVVNPRGMINSEIFDFIPKKLKEPLKYLVYVEGEEDLLVLPAVLTSEHNFVFYGQPPITDADPPIPSGCVGIYLESDIKSKYNAILERFDKVN
jgi:uncharacterized protein (UPF0218 family)